MCSLVMSLYSCDLPVMSLTITIHLINIGLIYTYNAWFLDGNTSTCFLLHVDCRCAKQEEDEDLGVFSAS